MWGIAGAVRGRVAMLLLSVALAAAGCSGGTEAGRATPPSRAPSPTATTATSTFPSFDEADALAASRPVAFRAANGVRLAGRLFGSGPVGVVLSHMRPGDQDQWLKFAALLAEEGYRVLTFNRRGTCPGEELGCSAGHETGAEWQDLAPAVRVLRDAGARRVVVGGASLGAMESLYALSRGLDADGLIWVSGLDLYQGVPATRQVRGVHVPKLFVAGEGDGDAAAVLPGLRRSAPAPATVLSLETGEHGTDMLSFGDAAVADELRRAVLDFLERI